MQAEIKAQARILDQLGKKLQKASDARFNLPIGSSRAKVTTANARLNTLCEAHDREENKYMELMARYQREYPKPSIMDGNK